MYQVQSEEESPRRGKLRILKNLGVISLSICLLFTAYDGLSMLQSTMNKQHGVGTASQASLYFGFCVSSLLLPKYVIKKAGCKATLALSTALFVPYIAANFYPGWATLIPSALLMGVGASLLWGSQCTYFNQSALMYCTLSEEETPPRPPPKSSVEVLSVRKVGPDQGMATPPFKSTEELVTNELSPRDFYESYPPRSDSIKSTAKRRFSVTLIEGELQNADGVPNASYDASNPRKSVGYIEAIQKFRGLESVTARFFGFNGLALHSAQIWSNLVSYYVLSRDQAMSNVTSAVVRNASCACGAGFCNADPSCLEEGGVGAIGDDTRYLLTGISVVLSVLAVVILVALLNPLPADREAGVSFSFRLMLATLDHCRKSREQQFLIFISFYVGMIQGFYTADFTKSFVGCAWGTSHVGLVTIFYGMACAFAATASGLMVKYVGRIPLMALAQGVNVAVNALLLSWTPDPRQEFLFYVAAAMWGIVLGTFWVLLPAFYGMIFKKDEEAAFGAYYLWSSLGWFMSFSYSEYICTSIKMYILIVISSVGFVGYLITERMYSFKKNQVGLKYAD